jgi:hypothetical protein
MTLFVILFLNNAFERYSTSAQAMALAHALTASAHGVHAIRSNPATLAILEKNHLLCGYEYVFSGIEGLHHITIGYARPLFGTGFGIQMSEFGFSEQKEQAITCACGIGLSEDFKLGLGGDVYLIDNKRLGKGFAYGLNIAFSGTLYKRWSLGVYGHNINQPQFGSTEQGTLPRKLQAGLGYEPFDGIISEVDLSIIDNNMRVHLAGEFRLFDSISFRTGIRTNPSVIAMGTGIRYKLIIVDYAVEFIPELPLTHNINIEFEF